MVKAFDAFTQQGASASCLRETSLLAGGTGAHRTASSLPSLSHVPSAEDLIRVCDHFSDGNIDPAEGLSLLPQCSLIMREPCRVLFSEAVTTAQEMCSAWD